MVRKTVDFPCRKFNGKYLDADGWHATKNDAQQVAYLLKQKGYLARVVKAYGGYIVYTDK